MSLFRPKAQVTSAPRQGRPGTIRAIIAGVGAMLLAVAMISGLRLAAQDGSEIQQTATSAATARAMAQLVAPPPPATFGLSDNSLSHSEPPDGTVVFTARKTTPEPDCVNGLEQFLRPVSIAFEQRSSEVEAQNAALLSRISEAIMECDAAYVMVAGHADSSGEDSVNLALSWERADRTLDTLLMLGVDPSSVEAIGLGAREPLSQGSDEEDNADRRVDFRVMRKP
ncbi:OmpA family protein [Sulfitobacter sp. F26204]|uniref:OmpA family protein n=1 Tax=Sulfitobacter sp. F26204 TaxID=2996014 RepID=UPI00225E4B2A|nr:OmpA family protein [Sulfitobacter sp. F26204]MCX7558541.1 OmpA family protein [Sulfitobacter sp. F26204]